MENHGKYGFSGISNIKCKNAKNIIFPPNMAGMLKIGQIQDFSTLFNKKNKK